MGEMANSCWGVVITSPTTKATLLIQLKKAFHYVIVSNDQIKKKLKNQVFEI